MFANSFINESIKFVNKINMSKQDYIISFEKQLCLILLFFTSCSVSYIKRPAVCYNVYKSANCYVYQFETLIKKEYIDCTYDSLFCSKNDTFIIKITKKRIIFEKKL